MNVKLLDNTKLSNAVIAGRTAWDSFHLGGNYEKATDTITSVDKEFLVKLVLKYRHESIIEQVVYNISVKNISRALLQQWSRSRHISQTVKSTRYVNSKKMKLKKTENEDLNKFVEQYFADLLLNFGNLSNDEIKYAYPESVTTDLVVQLNARELRHIFGLRTKKSAMKEYRILMKHIYSILPKSHLFLYDDVYSEID